MLNETELNQLYQHLNLSQQAQQIIAEIRSSPPVRRVRSAAGNVSVRYPSRKMGVIIQAESHRNELAGVYEKEYDPETQEYYDQPSRIKLVYQAKNGRRISIWHTPDYFVIRNDSIGWEEWKMEAELLRLAEQMPHRYVREESTWHCPPGEEHANQFGLFYRVRSSAEIDWGLQRNLLFLEDYLRADKEDLDEKAVCSLASLVAEHPGITLQELLAIGKGPSDVVFAMIARGRFYVDLRASPLAEPQRVRIFRDQETAQGYATIAASSCDGGSPFVTIALGASVVWDGRSWTIVNLGATQATLLAMDGTLIDLPQITFESLIKSGRFSSPKESMLAETHPTIHDLLAKASPADFDEANRRYALITSRLAGRSITDRNIPARTIRDWLSKWQEAEARYRCGYVGLLSHHQSKGNRQQRLPDNVSNLLETFILEDYETLKQKSKVAVYGALVRECEERGIVAPSYKTFAQAIQKRPHAEQVLKRQGKRAAYQHEAFYLELALTTPRHGDRPFEIGHIDHTLLDIELVCSHTGRNLGRPWGTFLSDAFSRRLLAVTLTFDPPSYRACMMVLRECVQRHGRLPQIVVVDGGREFESIYFETLLARYECSKKTRPGAKPRFGSVCERLFGTTNTRFIYNLLGNTQITRNVRQVTKSVSPQEQACWTLGQFYTRLCEWAYEVYDTLDHPALGQSPQDAFTMGMALGGQRLQRLIPYDETFRMLTLPTTRKGTAKIMAHLGVKINALCYWSDALLDPEAEKTQVPVRYDPFDAWVAYAFIKGRWTQCLSEHYAIFAGRSEREIQLATAELRKRNQLHGQQFTITARKLADFLTSLEAEELLLEQRLRDAEAREMLAPKEQPIPIQTASLREKESYLVASSKQEDQTKDETLDIYEDF
ncbi:MAG: DDE-type integrase/transposase/recombinase [Chloroflexi bacterium]|nr:DDE-type integrase/transposase/recombinase [Chloroflexota bacterium]